MSDKLFSNIFWLWLGLFTAGYVIAKAYHGDFKSAMFLAFPAMVAFAYLYQIWSGKEKPEGLAVDVEFEVKKG